MFLLRGFRSVPVWLALASCAGATDALLFDAPKTADDVKPIQLLVLNSGRVVKGDVKPGAGGYMVEQPHGRVFLPHGDVRLEATDLSDAYAKLRKSLPELTANSHIALARWCVAQNLYAFAKRELRSALEMEPDRVEARQLIDRIDRQLQRPTATSSKTTESKPDSGDDGNQRSLAGLSRETAREFVLRVQPILLNSCSRSRCHGPTDRSDFTLYRFHHHGRRIATERNLSSALSMIDASNPSASRLLDAVGDVHGPARRKVLYGRAGDDQRKVIERWVSQVAEETHRQSSADDDRVGASPPATPFDRGPTPVTAASETPGRATKRTGIVQVAAQQRPVIDRRPAPEVAATDPFSPAAFNQRNQSTGGDAGRLPPSR